MTETRGEILAACAARCQAYGLLMTAPRRAILAAMSTLDAPCDAAKLWRAAREHHAATSMGTVYRLLRELEKRGLAVAHAQPHAPLRWRLAVPAPVDAMPRQNPDNLCVMQQQVQNFLRELEKLGLAEWQPAHPLSPTISEGAQTHRSSAVAATLGVLRSIAGHLGYRLA